MSETRNALMNWLIDKIPPKGYTPPAPLPEGTSPASSRRSSADSSRSSEPHPSQAPSSHSAHSSEDTSETHARSSRQANHSLIVDSVTRNTPLRPSTNYIQGLPDASSKGNDSFAKATPTLGEIEKTKKNSGNIPVIEAPQDRFNDPQKMLRDTVIEDSKRATQLRKNNHP